MDKQNSNTVNLSDTKCFQEKYNEYFSALKYFAMRYVKEEECVRDLLQDTFVKLWEKGEIFKNEEVFKVYLYRAIRNNCLTYIRDTKRREDRLADYKVEDSEESFVHRMIEAEVYALINEVFEELPPAVKNVYIKSLEGKSHREIADELHIAINTIKSHKNHANRYLKARLKSILNLLLYVG
jgi:RNA polymerase sigma-70 factor (ECF subfamily)